MRVTLIVPFYILSALVSFLNVARRDVALQGLRYLIDPEKVTQMRFDHACSLHGVMSNRYPQELMTVEIKHDR